MSHFVLSAVATLGVCFIFWAMKPYAISMKRNFSWPNTFRASEEIYRTSRVIEKEWCFRSLLQDKIQRKWSCYPCDTQLREKGIYISLQPSSEYDYCVRLLVPWEAIEKAEAMTFNSVFLLFVAWRMRKRDYLMLTLKDTPIILYLPCDKVDVNDIMSKMVTE